jgi:hypothetical protein
MAECQLAFRRYEKPDLPFEAMYRFGTSTRNQRIESWWNLLTTGQTEQWKKHFEALKAKGFFDSSDYDIIALWFIYMPIIRQHVYTFVEVHNTHRIHFQRNQAEYLPTGKPYIMYAYPPPNVQDYATPVDPILLSELEAQVENYSTDVYQTPQVEAFCTDFLIQHGFSLEFLFDPNESIGEAKHIQAYKLLRQGLFQFEKNGGHLERLETPIGAHKWIQIQQEIKEQQERWQREGQDEGTLISEVETDDNQSNGGNSDDGFELDLDVVA